MIPIALVLLLQGQTQQKPVTTSLATYMAAHPWDAAQKGPLVVLDPEHKTTTKDPVNLEAFDRKLVTVGAVSAIVPRTMVVIDDSLTQSPNMYEGLPAEAKVLYLLRSLTEDQWKTLNDSSIGLNDLHDEQKLVFQSLLPKPLAWSTYLADANGMWGPKQAGGTLTDEELPNVRLKVQRYVALQVYLNAGAGSSGFGSTRFKALPGDPFSIHDYDPTPTEQSFGVKMRSVVDNQSKDANLDYSNLTAKVSIPSGLTLREVLPKVGAAVHRELIADYHIANRPVTVLGDKVSSGDLLKVLALCVTGTYRRVGSAYVLTSDITGTGNRQMRVAAWESILQYKLGKDSEKWRQEVGKTAGFSAMSFGGGPTMAPPKDLLGSIDKGDEFMPVNVTSDKLGSGLVKLLDQWDHEYTTQPIMKDHVGVSSEISYSFVLPDGTQLAPENQSLGDRSRFFATNRERPPQPPPNVPLTLPKSMRFQVAVHAETPGEIDASFPRLVAHGFKRVWLESNDAATITEAIAKGKASQTEVALVINPWQLPQGDSDADLTIFGDHGSGVVERISQSNSWKSWIESQNIIAPKFLDLMAPGDPNVSERWKQLASLAAIPGLADVALQSTEPPGYEPKRADWHSILGPLEWALVGHGYSEAQRLEFLRANATDPIDLPDPEIMGNADLEQPFFPQALGRGMGDSPLLTKWRTTVSAKNNKEVAQLVALLRRTLWIEVRSALVNTMPSGFGIYSMWKPGEELPTGTGQQTIEFVPHTEGLLFMPMPAETISPVASNRGDWILSLSKSPTAFPLPVKVILDFTRVPITEVGAALDRWFVASG